MYFTFNLIFWRRGSGRGRGKREKKTQFKWFNKSLCEIEVKKIRALPTRDGKYISRIQVHFDPYPY